jgi:beta-phosphoglucomutase-like phosphatase (HAD superfamily)
MSVKKQLKGVLFDFNGTLFPDTVYHVRAFEQCFKNHGLNVPDFQFIITNLFGLSNELIYKKFFDSNATLEDCKKFAEEKEGLYYQFCLNSPLGLQYTKGACELMTYLKENNIPYALATGAGMDNITFYNENMELAKWFDRERIVCADDDVKCKPDPEIYEYAASKIGLKASECIVFEDGTLGLIAANKANAGAAIAIYEEGLPSPLIEGAQAEAIYHDFSDWKKILEEFGL